MKKETLIEVLNKLRTILNMDPIEMDEVETTDVVEPTEVEQTEVEMAEGTLEDGTVIYYDGELGVDTAVFKDVEGAEILEDGDYVLENGDTFVIVEGIVTEYVAVEVEAEPEAEVEEELSEIELLKELIADLKSRLENFKKTEAHLNAQIEKLNAEPDVEPLSTTPQETRELTIEEKRLNTLNVLKTLNKK